ncbi:MAG: winged helix-turn-helix transcriptional regulator [Anaerolineae bacterium]|nr:MAG: winged helix-turn-helix transcriptional regulator [Anaerolineae bacterium]
MEGDTTIIMNIKSDLTVPVITCTTSGEPIELRLSTERATTLAELFKLLSHPVRLQILDILSRHSGQVCVCEIERHFKIRQPTISHHLRLLREGGLIEGEQRGLWVYYHLCADQAERVKALLGQ